MLEYRALSENYREKTTSANFVELCFVMRQMYKAGHEDHPLDYYIVVSDLERGYFLEAGLFAGRSLVSGAFVAYAVASSLR